MGDTSGQTPSDSSPPPPTDQSSAPPPQQSSSSPPPPDASSPPPSSPPPSSPSPPPPSESPPASSPPPPEQSTTPSPPAPAETTTSTKASPPPPTFKAPASGTTSTPSRPAAVPSTTKSPVTSGSVQSAPSPPSSSNTKGFIIGGLVCGIFIIVMIVVMVACLKKKKKKYYEPPPPLKGDQNYRNWNSSPPKDYIVQLDPGHQPKSSWDANNEFASPRQPMSPMNIGPNQSSFSYEQLAAATSGFSQDNILGQGGFGYVHKGVLPNGKEIAVKSLKSGSGQGEREFQAEVEIISRVHHRHLVSLVGYCIADGQRMLVYEFVPNKTLEFHLHGKGQPVMSWATRMRIALGASKGLAYLHEDCHPRIIHRDIKAANILLDNNFEAMVADFGLAKLSTDNNTHVSTRVMGTFGYLAPEYAASGKLTDKSDVFSFGVMLLEIITGRKPVDRSSNYMDDSLVDWARPLLGKALENRNYDGIVDTLLENEYDADEMARMVACAAASIRHSAKMRPKMIQIVRALEGDSSLDEIIAGPKPVQNSISSNDSTGNETGLYDTGAYNADMMKFREMVLTNNAVTSSEFGGTSEYGLNPSYTSSDVSDLSVERRHKM